MDVFDQVAEFQNVFAQPVAAIPAALDKVRAKQRRDFLAEEFDEYEQALAAGDFIEQLDGLTDIIYIAAGTMIEMVGPHLAREIFNEVHASNLSKTDPVTGKAIIKDGKVQKGAAYFRPDIADVIS